MKILQVNATFGIGSTGTIVRYIHDSCMKHGYDSYVAYAKADFKIQNGYKIGNWFSNKLHAVLSRISGKQGYFSFFSTLMFLRYLKKLKPDIIHLHNLHANYINLPMLLRFLAKNEIKTVITLHDCWWYTGGCFHYTLAHCNKWLKKCGMCPKRLQDTPAYLIDRSPLIHEDRKELLLNIKNLKIVGVSDWISNEARKSFLAGTQILTIHNGIDIRIFKQTSSSIRHKLGVEDKFIILGPASKWLQPYNKSILDYFTQNMTSDEILLLYGVENTNINVPQNVVLYGYTRNTDELAALYSCADVFVNPSYEDSLSLINIEAQACGTPVITYSLTGPKETVDNVNSVSVSPERYRDILDIIRNKIAHSDSKTSVRDFVAMKFDKNLSNRNHLNLYEQLSKE